MMHPAGVLTYIYAASAVAVSETLRPIYRSGGAVLR